jgi:hypothetical protein
VTGSVFVKRRDRSRSRAELKWVVMCSTQCAGIRTIQAGLVDGILSSRLRGNDPVRGELAAALHHLSLARSAAHRVCLSGGVAGCVHSPLATHT